MQKMNLAGGVDQSATKLLGTINKALILTTIFEKTFTEKGSNILILKNQNILLTKLPKEILDNFKLIHPIQILMKEYVNVMDKEGSSVNFMLVLFGKLLRSMLELLKKGAKVVTLRNDLVEIKNEILKILESQKFMTGDLKLIIESHIDSLKISELLLESVNEIYKIDRNERKSLDKIQITEDGGDIRIFKMNTGDINDSYFINGMVVDILPLNNVPNFEDKKNLRVAIFNSSLGIIRTSTTGTILLNKPEELLNFDKDEDLEIENLFESLNVDVIFCNQAEKKYLEFAERKNILVFKINSKFEMKRVQKLTGSSVSNKLCILNENEKGFLSKIKITEKGNKRFTELINKNSKICSIVLRDSLSENLEENSRKIQNCLKILAKIKNEKLSVLRGNGKIEKLISAEIEGNYLTSKKQVADAVKSSFINVSEILNNNSKKENLICDYNSRKRAVECAFDFLNDILMCDDYFMVES